MGFSEFTLIAIIALVVIGPKRLPEAARFAGLWVGRARRMMAGAKTEFEKEFGLDEVRQQLHNERVMDELKKQVQGEPSTSQQPAPPKDQPPSSESTPPV